MEPLCPPVLLLIFNRPDHTAQVMEQIRDAEPPKLFVGADGPRANHPDDAERCEQARDLATQVDWDCEVHTLFRDENLGCKEAVSSAITWFFEHVDEGILLEDDCIPSQSFFPFCEYILDEYRNDTRVSMVSGQNPLGTWNVDKSSYHFSSFGGIWGWATWSSMWQMYEIEEEAKAPWFVREVLKGALREEIQVTIRNRGVQRALTGELDSWAYQWFYARLLNHTVSAVPSRNLVSNIGFGEQATHTTNAEDQRGQRKLRELEFPLESPMGVFPDRKYDQKWFEEVRGISSNLLNRTLQKLKIKVRRYINK